MSKPKFGDVIECKDGSEWVVVETGTWVWHDDAPAFQPKVLCIKPGGLYENLGITVGNQSVCLVFVDGEYHTSSWRFKR